MRSPGRVPEGDLPNRREDAYRPLADSVPESAALGKTLDSLCSSPQKGSDKVTGGEYAFAPNNAICM